MSLTYSTGEPVLKGDHIRYHGEVGEVEFLAERGDPDTSDLVAGGGVWIGEILIDTQGRVSGVWTIREVTFTPPIPLLNKAITDAVAKWQFAPAAVDKVPVPICRTVSVNVNLKAMKAQSSRKVQE
jgi:hypothetical protein